MRYARVFLEAVHLVVALIATVLLFWAGAWAYPQGAQTIWFVGYATLVAVVVLAVPSFVRAWRQDRAVAR